MLGLAECDATVLSLPRYSVLGTAAGGADGRDTLARDGVVARRVQDVRTWVRGRGRARGRVRGRGRGEGRGRGRGMGRGRGRGKGRVMVRIRGRGRARGGPHPCRASS